MLTPSTLQQSILNDLTNRQQEVLQTAFGMGYYEWPRDCTGQDVADELGIIGYLLRTRLCSRAQDPRIPVWKRRQDAPDQRDVTAITGPVTSHSPSFVRSETATQPSASTVT